MKRLLTRRNLIAFFAVVAAALVGVEMTARLYLGLGDPPLYITHPSIEYMLAPHQQRHRFGNRVDINAYGMRSPDFPDHKTSPDELRVMVIGDSVVFGGTQVDQADLATTLLQQKLAESTRRPTVVGNISAGSWGPPNILAYVKTYGLFDADVVLIVLSSHDAADRPTFEPLNPNTHPTRTPLLATWEGATRYLPRYLPGGNGASAAPPEDGSAATDEDLAVSLGALASLIELIQESGARAVVVQHWTQQELSTNQPQPGHGRIAELAQGMGVPVLQTAEAMGSGEGLYSDFIHPSSAGQRALAEVLFGASVLEPANEGAPPIDPGH